MKLEIKSPTDLINNAYLQQPPARSELELFCSGLTNLLGHLQSHNREEHQKNQISDFLKDVWYRKTNLINTAGDIDLAIYEGLSASTPVSVIIETKSSTNAAEMMSREKPNAKALHEIILYYLREVFDKENYSIKQLIVTNSLEWFIFDGVWFERNVRRNVALVKAYKSFKAEGHDNRHFYESIARPWLETLEEPLPCCWFDLRDFKIEPDNKSLIALYKFLSPQHLLKLPFINDSNSLNREFYGELLHIMGLEEVKEKGKKLIRRVAPERRNDGALLENTINLLKVRQALEGVKNLSEYGAETEEQYFSVALELCITWLNRILFLKLLEGRLIAWNPGEPNHAFLNRQRINDYDELQELFFEVLARKQDERTNDVKIKFGDIPYLNSSLFEMTLLEKSALQISNLKQRLTIPLNSSTVLKNDAGKRRGGELNTLQYLFEFLDSYDFASEGKTDVKEAPKTIINASVLGLIFEKINGYRDGSFYTPGYITMYMSREAIRRTVLQKFNERYAWSCADFVELHNALGRVDIKEANEIVNSIKICDPAVGSGHFLVSALNEIVAIKAELKILMDKEGRLLRDYVITVENDELKILDGNIPFTYRPGNEDSQRVQETLFREKAAIIEGSLFGVDINPKSVAICRLRLWIELLKSAYYKPNPPQSPLIRGEACSGGEFFAPSPDKGRAGEGLGVQLETLPNIDINIKCGNSLVSRFSLNDDKTGFSHYAPVERKRLKELTKRYKEKVWLYKLGEKGPSNKGILRREIEAIKEEWRTFSLPSDFYMKELFNLKNELTQAVFAFDEVGHQRREKLHERAAELEVTIAARQSTVYSNAFEWRFEFPEVLDEEGSFAGFDVVVGNPPYIPIESMDKAQREQFKSKYQQLERKFDTSALFFLQGFGLLKNEGILSYIAPLTWQTGENYIKFRKFFVEYAGILKIINLPFDVFDDAYVDTGIYFMTTTRQDHFDMYAYDKKAKAISFDDISFESISVNGLDPLTFKLSIGGISALLAKSIKEGFFVTLGDITKSTQGLAGSCFNKVDDSIETAYSFLEKGNVYNYQLIIDVISSVDMTDKKSLQQFYMREPKLLIRRIVNRQDRLSVGYTEKQMVFKKDINPFILTDERFSTKFLLGVMASKLISSLYIASSVISTKDDFRQTTLSSLRNLPIPKATPEQQTPIIDIVDQILAAKKADPKADTTELELSIDSLVYRLYGLDEEERKMLEGTK